MELGVWRNSTVSCWSSFCKFPYNGEIIKCKIYDRHPFSAYDRGQAVESAEAGPSITTVAILFWG